jgi:hypothetical protein
MVKKPNNLKVSDTLLLHVEKPNNLNVSDTLLLHAEEAK